MQNSNVNLLSKFWHVLRSWFVTCWARKFGVWPGSKLVGVSGRTMVCGGCAVYGPRTTLYIAVDTWNYALELCLAEQVDPSAEPSWRVLRRISEIGEGKLFAPANMRAAQDHAGYKNLLEYYMSTGYTLRYTGGMVPDVIQLLVKGKGVFSSPSSAAAPAKLRLLYEAMPMAFLVEHAGGSSTDGAMNVLDRVVGACDERTPICLGSQDEVTRYIEYCQR
jgi:sedoheptulose-bisphosphatase